jgi:hypothetical protein
LFKRMKQRLLLSFVHRILQCLNSFLHIILQEPGSLALFLVRVVFQKTE